MPGHWSLETGLLALGIVVWGVGQYGLAFWALRDLLRRPRVRGDNKVVWALVILTLPVVGALLYASIGPTSFFPRPARVDRAPVAADRSPRPRGVVEEPPAA